MKFAPIFFHRSFRSLCPTVGPNLRDNLSGNRKLPLIVGPRSNMSDYHWSPTIIIFPQRKFSRCPIFHPTLRSVGQWDASLRINYGQILLTKTIWYEICYVFFYVNIKSSRSSCGWADCVMDSHIRGLGFKTRWLWYSFFWASDWLPLISIIKLSVCWCVWKVREGFPDCISPKTLKWVIVYSSVTLHING